MERYLCIHGHFYQPPRENPWIEAVETQDSAYPYHDWNERITAECYATNAASRLLDEKGRIRDIVNNYAKISFDIGPTLLSWLEDNAPDVYGSILEADAQSAEWRSGHGSAIAQGYNHMILPLANRRDKATQIEWGIRDFQRRFKRDPEGMWLPETAVDMETLGILAANGIKYTLLAQHQAARVIEPSTGMSHDVSGASIDPAKAYSCRLPSKKNLAIFFYDGPVSRAVAFEGLLKSGEIFANRLMEGFSAQRNFPQIMHIATDGESYGHHHRFGEMALSYALEHIERNGLARITNYGEFLELHPPKDEVEIMERTAWSCAHGLGRWSSDCGCSSGAHPKWSQGWRAPLRQSLDWLRDKSAKAFDKVGPKYFRDPWAARNDYIEVINDRSDKAMRSFISKHAHADISESDRTIALVCMELQRNTMLMYTSCGWFFDDLTGIETLQILNYAARAIQMHKRAFGENLEDEFLSLLEHAKSNIKNMGGREIFNKYVKPNMVTLQKVAAHFAISSMFDQYGQQTSIYCYDIEVKDYSKTQASGTLLVTGLCTVKSRITYSARQLCFALLHIGGHDFTCGVIACEDGDEYGDMSEGLVSTFEGGAFADVIRQMDKTFGSDNLYSLRDLFHDEQRTILQTITEETMKGIEETYEQMYTNNSILMSFLGEMMIPIPKAFRTATEYTLNRNLRRLLKVEADAEAVHRLIEEFEKWDAKMDALELEFTFRRTLEREMKSFLDKPDDLERLVNLTRLVGISLSLPFEFNLRYLQDIYFRLSKVKYREVSSLPGDDPRAWVESFRLLGQKLGFNLDRTLG